MFYLSLGVSILFFLLSLYIVLFNWNVILLLARNSKSNIPSIIPVAGGLLGSFSIKICPLIDDGILFVVPFVIDPGTWIILIIIFPPLERYILARNALRHPK
jgi:hypothetical protein